MEGAKEGWDDSGMRAPMAIPDDPGAVPQPWLPDYLARLALVRQEHDALRFGDYTELHVSSEQFAFRRTNDGEVILVTVNASAVEVTIDLPAAVEDGTVLLDHIDGVSTYTAGDGILAVTMAPNSARVMGFA